jgi:hypothetical protein
MRRVVVSAANPTMMPVGSRIRRGRRIGASFMVGFAVLTPHCALTRTKSLFFPIWDIVKIIIEIVKNVFVFVFVFVFV